jgi:hypothetical protein
MAPKPKKVTTPKKKIDYWKDFNFLNTYTPAMEQGIRSRNAEQERLKNLRTGIFGAGGALAQNREEGVNTQNRIADEMAYRGMLSSGAYSGPQKGVATQAQSAYQQQDTNLKSQYDAQTNPINLLEQGLKMNPDGSVSPLAPGETIINPATGKKEKYSWDTQTDAGRRAKAAALAQWTANTVKTKI